MANNDFGITYENAFKTVLGQSPHKDKIEFVTETLRDHGADGHGPHDDAGRTGSPTSSSP